MARWFTWTVGREARGVVRKGVSRRLARAAADHARLAERLMIWARFADWWTLRRPAPPSRQQHPTDSRSAWCWSQRRPGPSQSPPTLASLDAAGCRRWPDDPDRHGLNTLPRARVRRRIRRGYRGPRAAPSRGLVGPARLGLALLAGVALCAAFPGSRHLAAGPGRRRPPRSRDVWRPGPHRVPARPGHRPGLLRVLAELGRAPSSASSPGWPWPSRRRCSWPCSGRPPRSSRAAAEGTGRGSGRWSWPSPGSCRRRCATGCRTAASRGCGSRSARRTRPFGRLAALAGAPAVTFAVALAGGLLAAGVWAAVLACSAPLPMAGDSVRLSSPSPARSSSSWRGSPSRCRPTVLPAT